MMISIISSNSFVYELLCLLESVRHHGEFKRPHNSQEQVIIGMQSKILLSFQIVDAAVILNAIKLYLKEPTSSLCGQICTLSSSDMSYFGNLTSVPLLDLEAFKSNRNSKNNRE